MVVSPQESSFSSHLGSGKGRRRGHFDCCLGNQNQQQQQQQENQSCGGGCGNSRGKRSQRGQHSQQQNQHVDNSAKSYYCGTIGHKKKMSFPWVDSLTSPSIVAS